MKDTNRRKKSVFLNTLRGSLPKTFLNYNKKINIISYYFLPTK